MAPLENLNSIRRLLVDYHDFSGKCSLWLFIKSKLKYNWYTIILYNIIEIQYTKVYWCYILNHVNSLISVLMAFLQLHSDFLHCLRTKIGFFSLCNLDVFISFSCLVELARTTSIILNISSKTWHPSFILNPTGSLAP